MPSSRVTHESYERMPQPADSDEASGANLRAFQREVCSWITVPE